MMTDDPLPFLTTFLRVADLGSFTAAGRTLGITQAAVSQRIQQLEAALRTAVFRRNAGRIALTDAGAKLDEYARRIVELHQEARHAVAERRKEINGDLLLAASSIPGQYVLPPILAAFRRAQPHVNVRVRITDTEDVCRVIEQDRAHLGFTGDSPSSRSLLFTPFANDDLALIVPASHPLSRRRRVGLRDVIREPLILRENGSGSRRCLERALRRIGHDLDAMNCMMEVGSNEAVKEAVLRGLGVAVVSRRSVHNEIITGTLTAIPLIGITLDRRLFVVQNRRRTLTPASRDFLQHLHLEKQSPP